MNNTFSLEQISKTGSLVNNLITRICKLDFLDRFMEIKSVNLTLRQDQIAKKLGCSSSTLQRFRNDTNMFSPYRIPPNSTNKKQKISNGEHHLKKPQRTSNDHKKLQ